MKQNILFSKILNVADEYSPKPASKFIPEWYKKMETRFPQEKTPDSLATIKKCIPVLDAITAGYILVTPGDIYVTIEDGVPKYRSVIDGLISDHPLKQGYAHPNANGYAFPKWNSPWGIKTPKGWSCYFKPPAHNPNPWFQVLEGIVDTDDYTAPVNFPFVLLNPEKECLIPAGTPMVQVIPIKRDDWQMHITEDTKKAENILRHINSQFFDRYKRMYWKRKEYK